MDRSKSCTSHVQSNTVLSKLMESYLVYMHNFLWKTTDNLKAVDTIGSYSK